MSVQAIFETGSFLTATHDFKRIPGSPVAYWVSDRMREIFATSQSLGEVFDARQG